MPILADLTPFMVEETSSLSLGVYHSARALGAFYRNVYEQMVEPTPPLFELPTRCSASQRAPQFHCGFRVNGSPFALSRYLSKNALGHCGAMGQSFGALDLELGFVVAACSNHVFANESDALSWRDRVVAKCFAAL